MATGWRTDPYSMDNPLMRPSAQSLQKPQVFVKVEFGVSWTGQHPPRQRGFQYKSRALRERNPDFPRHVPAPTTNYLAASSVQPFPPNHPIPQFYFQHAPQLQEQQSNVSQSRNQPRGSQPPYNSSTSFLLPEPHEPARGRSRYLEAVPEPPPLGPCPGQQCTPSSGGRHERGSSAPPPLSDNHWDVVQQSSSAQCTAGPSIQPTAAEERPSDVWKELPEVPTRFRLGEDDMPWEGTWTFPMGFEPFLEPDPYLRPESAHSSRRPSSPQHTIERSRTFPEQSGSPGFTDARSSVFQSPARGDDPARRRDLEALGSAMMTVDNGFENQWWNQDERGERRQLAVVQPPPATEEQVEERMALGWVGALLPGTAPGDILNARRMSLVGGRGGESVFTPESSVGGGGRSYNNMVVSPVSTYSGPVSNLSRSMSTRSDELCFGGRYA